jgi:hypothetical protein
MPKASRIAILGLIAAGLTTGAIACDKSGGGGGSGGRKSPRAKWVDTPKSGKTTGTRTTIPGIDVIFMKPEVLYVYKECGEASHVADGPDKGWVPVIRCESSVGAGEEVDEFADEDESVSLTIYATHKDTVINERTVETFRSRYQQAGFVIDEIVYQEEYLSKPGRRGIYSKVHKVDSDGYPVREVQRFMFPKDDVVFIAHVDYPYGDDRSGIMNDWERILWNFEYTEEQSLATMTSEEIEKKNAEDGVIPSEPEE